MNRIIPTAALALTLATTGLAASPASASPIDSGMGVVTKSYTTKQVAKHNTAGNCWTIVGSGVYNLTSYVKKHPGGRSRIIRLCGKNGTAAFRNQHGTGGKPNRVIKAYKIGTVK
jgi:cytochrome b involved in lipid metabolism